MDRILMAGPIKNRRATFDYFIEERFEAGLVLRGWEVKSVRAGRATINLAHVYVRDGELFLCNAHMTPADQISTHEKPEMSRTRKLLMHKREIERLIGKVERAGYAASNSRWRSRAAKKLTKSATIKVKKNGSARKSAL